MPCVHDLTTFLFLILALRSGDVFGLVGSVAWLGENGLKVANGSCCSTLGVGLGELSAELLNQKCFFLVGGLPLLVTAGEPEADNGLFGRFTITASCTSPVRPRPSVEGSAVTGLLRGLMSDPIGLQKDCSAAHDSRGFGLVAIELILPVTE